MLRQFLSITGGAVWKQRVKSLIRQFKQNTYLQFHLRQLHSLELAFSELMHVFSRSGTVPKIASAEQYRLYAFIATTTMIYQRLTPAGQKRLRGRLLGGLKDRIGLTPLQQEMTVAAHLLSRGFDVKFSDLEIGKGFDFLAQRDDIELEVECKRVGLDLGRKITRRETLELHKYLKKALSPIAVNLRGGLFVRVTLPSRLSASHKQREQISSLVGKALRTGVGIYDQSACQISIIDFDINTSPFMHGGPPDEAFSLRIRGFPPGHRELKTAKTS